MKVIGIMCVKDEADLLLEVLPHIRDRVDDLLVYDDGSQDNTWDILRDSKLAYKVRREAVEDERPNIPRPNYHKLLEVAKENYDYNKEPVWCAITMGDRFFLNKNPRELAIEGEEAGLNGVEGVQVDFLRCRADPWTEENDTFPVWSPSLRHQCRWVKADERCIVMFKLTDECTYAEGAKYPWPQKMGLAKYSYATSDKLSRDMPFLEHVGRRSPRAAMWRHTTGSRPVGRKGKHLDFSSFESTMDGMKRFYNNYKMIPWMGLQTIDDLVRMENEECWKDRTNLRYYCKGIEHAFINIDKGVLPPREDI